MQLRIDHEFKTLLPALQPDEYAKLEQSLISEGCRDSLVVWSGHDIIVDGHNRYELCTKHGIEYNVTERHFDSRNDIILWIVANQLGRRNLIDAVRAQIALRLKPVIAEKAKERMVTSAPGIYGGKPPVPNSAQAVETGKTDEKIAEIAGVSKDTIQKVEKVLGSGNEETSHKMLSGELSIHAAHKEVKAQEKIKQRDELKQKALSLVDNNVVDNIKNCDMKELEHLLEDKSVDLFLTDPPYPAEFLPLYGELARIASLKLKPGKFCIAYSGQTHLPQVINLMSEYLDYWWCFAIAHSGGNQQIFHRDVMCGWKPVLVFTTKNNIVTPKPLSWVHDFVRGGGRDKKYHEWGQDSSEVLSWIEAFTEPDELIVDPFVGGGTIPLACKISKRNFFGTELDYGNFAQTLARIKEYETNKTIV